MINYIEGNECSELSRNPQGGGSQGTKTYLWTNTLQTNFPPEFVASKNKQYIN